jgi:hypothetical protein
MNSPTDDDFRIAYSAFGRNHAVQREVMLGRMAERAPTKSRQFLRPVLAAAIAALLISGLGIAGFEALRPTSAYGLDGLLERLQSLHSLHVKGTVFQRTKTPFGIATLRFPVERYYQRPSCYFSVGYGFSLNGNDDLRQVTKTYSANDGKRSLTVLEDQKKAILSSKVDPLETELYVENALQTTEVEALISRHPQDFERIGTERINGTWCDIHQSKPVQGFWQRVWIDPTSGLPVKVVGMSRNANGEAEPTYEFTEIRANVDPPPELFTFAAPAGYELLEIKDAPTTRMVQPTCSGSAGRRSAAEWVGLKIDDQTVLLCWSQWLQEKELKSWFHDPPRIVLQGAAERTCGAETLYETMSGDIRWRWSLVFPSDKKPIGTDALTIKFSDKKEGSVALSLQPLVFSETRLAEMVEKVQRRSLEAGGYFDPIKSLEQLRELAAKIRSSSERD